MAVYLAQPVGPSGGLVKIGYSMNPVRRVAELAMELKCPLRLVAASPGSRGTERCLHERFDSARRVTFAYGKRHMEWFWPTVDLDAFARSIGGGLEGVVPNKPSSERIRRSDGAKLFQAEVRSRDLTDSGAAKQLLCAVATVRSFMRGYSRPSSAFARWIELWSCKRVPVPSWTIRNGAALPRLIQRGGGRGARERGAAFYALTGKRIYEAA
jgi:hypothetical protein